MGRWMKIQQKRELIQKAADCPSMTQEELGTWAKAESLSEGYGDGKRRKPLQVTSSALEKLLRDWIMKVEANGVCLSRELIKMKARDIQKDLCDAWDLTFSDGWLTAFERRHRLKSRKLPGEAHSADPVAVGLGHQQLQEITDLYEPKDVYNMDETGLCYAMAPARSICTKGARGAKKKRQESPSL
ncbi:hypothetical protein PPTG_05213 [Phytophthora nicotianae INRA-310]|uniref:HTH CENPB-type domain-containing protein n=1 Tax=Phytophthora nicotianae (strain INRA-310) TaxID=761204 RepID=W2QWV5_PHYN3|nr:hypothetical protein PPTG_05213 [Phytophthora nicotianae INRA-310]ETN17401.1 hypothetical protein PPTG_05213 [Phytophthora nicotianae INRA-310]